MSQIISKEEAQRIARERFNALKVQHSTAGCGERPQLADVYTALAKEHGYKNWHHMAAALSGRSQAVVKDAATGENVVSLYDRDFYAWALQQAQLIRAGRFTDLDLENVAEEIESYAKTEKRELRERMRVLLTLMLKWLLLPGLQSQHAKAPIERQRDKVDERLQENPSLRAVLENELPDLYVAGRQLALAEIGLSANAGPVNCPWSFEQILDRAFWPED